jgi:SAM-dependent methyltransferase
LSRDVDKALIRRFAANKGVGDHPVIYAGRFADRIAEIALAEGCEVIGGGTPSPLLFAAVDRATSLVVLDPHSFPFEAMTESSWDVPLVVVLPSGLDSEVLVAALGTTLFERIGFFDRVAVRDPGVWQSLRRRYSWAEGQRVPLESEDFVREVVNLLSSPGTEADRRGKKGVGAQIASPRYVKAVHRAQARVLVPRFAAARDGLPGGAPLDVLQVGVGDGRWTSSFDSARTTFCGVDADADAIDAARHNFPDQRFARLGPGQPLPYADQTFDVAFSVNFVQGNPPSDRAMLLSEMWRVTRPAGRLLFLEDFVAEERETSPDPPLMSVLEFVDLSYEAMSGQVALEHMESLRYPQDDLVRGGALTLLRLGTGKER